ncbi:exodeoxyribonuclease VII, large subunit [Gloeothece citriformis PCC 7424]|uniref:Exodeoxyribonuclease 7 large subunit n=1 Tax=Gloeothece citriformis (strain PCC 7424) TaxID=65393 RepID=B7KAR4_GLOC7|nr:exodeoxyribonuclease VII large subunit [Gloeothece citriformis]ACK68736.1 exodeoxyribonuclease VII, large subunit [Gloeothece citriformis PCC 7424]
MSITFSETALSVSGLTTYIQDLLEGDEQLQQVWVTGEVSSLNDHPRGLFFTLSDPQVEAAVNCVVWNSQRLRLVEEPKVGAQILVLGSIRLYAKRGDYRLTVFQVLAVGEGLQALRYQQLRSRLQAEGLFDHERKRLLPLHPQTIAVVTSPTAAAWGDIQRTLSQRYPGLHLLFSPATVQGEEAPPSIVRAMERVNRDGRAEVMILARGGGSVEDLSCFNDERVVRAIALSQIPVITGIGHQRDESLADLVADVSVHTPTAAAERVVPDYNQLVIDHQQRVNRIIDSVRERLQQESNYLDQLHSRLTQLPTTSRYLAQMTAKCQLLKQKLIALDPQEVLKRGYAVVRKRDEKIIRTTDELVPEQELTIQLGQGFFKVKVTDILS